MLIGQVTFLIANPLLVFVFSSTILSYLGKVRNSLLIIDGSWRKDNRSAGIACVCYDANEEPIAQRAAQLNLPSAFAAEVTACQRAIQWAKEQRLLNIHIWPDSQILCLKGQ
ncbi:hypothetical protein CsSME_00014232 [Camellia sinensis var. sinensis]